MVEIQDQGASDTSAEACYGKMLGEQGVWAEGSSLFTCGATTGHFVRPIAFCDRPETARLLAQAFDALHPEQGR